MLKFKDLWLRFVLFKYSEFISFFLSIVLILATLWFSWYVKDNLTSKVILGIILFLSLVSVIFSLCVRYSKENRIKKLEEQKVKDDLQAWRTREDALKLKE